MFYSNDILLTKRFGLGKVWLAATLGKNTYYKKLSKRDLIDVNITIICNFIQSPPEPLALRFTSNLLFGIIRIYNQQVQFCYNDVTHMVSQIKNEFLNTNFNSTLLEISEARPGAITLIEKENLNFDDQLPLTFGNELSEGSTTLIEFGWVKNYDKNISKNINIKRNNGNNYIKKNDISLPEISINITDLHERSFNNDQYYDLLLSQEGLLQEDQLLEELNISDPLDFALESKENGENQINFKKRKFNKFFDQDISLPANEQYHPKIQSYYSSQHISPDEHFDYNRYIYNTSLHYIKQTLFHDNNASDIDKFSSIEKLRNTEDNNYDEMNSKLLFSKSMLKELQQQQENSKSFTNSFSFNDLNLNFDQDLETFNKNENLFDDFFLPGDLTDSTSNNKQKNPFRDNTDFFNIDKEQEPEIFRTDKNKNVDKDDIPILYNNSMDEQKSRQSNRFNFPWNITSFMTPDKNNRMALHKNNNSSTSTRSSIISLESTNLETPTKKSRSYIQDIIEISNNSFFPNDIERKDDVKPYIFYSDLIPSNSSIKINKEKLDSTLDNNEDSDILLSTLHPAGRDMAVEAFYHILILSTTGLIKPIQKEPYGDIKLEINNI
ncbi:hypothetical protein BCR36DRAFT_372207 [Piromyces finnis]|uniref:Rad21/Rec8-like protein N-terminal domain-containing protein n=1 Tax=Piromyces finnis TaxID=1754191 RepID=A0A1Y1V3K8_9FUNG|nr:hypothetical protein BCR36DRAFT_372207 [Piromyces finnis]|eukprot:ORX46379.1 hypothetical protein BCR36DRAFT_372207 [Piromyces finnis]